MWIIDREALNKLYFNIHLDKVQLLGEPLTSLEYNARLSVFRLGGAVNSLSVIRDRFLHKCQKLSGVYYDHSLHFAEILSSKIEHEKSWH